MKIADAMTKSVDTITAGSSIMEAARKMQEIGAGFLPITDANQDRLIGVTTDRDMVIRCLAEGKDPSATPVQEAMSEKVLYCFGNDELDAAAKSMAEQQVYRLVVLDSPESKRLVGIITVGDIRRHGDEAAAERAAERIADAA
ncbi:MULTISPECIES: CBS domain-containing protein [unclassified Ectothiorhodospira]|uniref:CBS domain-containing protein n=1 Tax=unclassified Ectothiorhodospira TaxID=2684909 RepID=UPI001EE87251|nr:MULTISPECIES: CBS domain-containing protein [unclassified Ectothiorhodospira]MCG5516803.1 CBS domain-containing protein [Ectothiorhodospira sp. 9100]MCG5519779.1 CBS domain-containing protein [Ectothiorhodospira sp. 9905]